MCAMDYLYCEWLRIMWGVGLGSLPLEEDGFPFLDVVRPDIELAAIVHLLPGLLLPVLLSGLLDALPLWS